MLIRAAMAWSRKSEVPAEEDIRSVDEKLMKMYVHRLQSSKTNPHDRMKFYFAELVHEFGVEAPASRAIEIDGSTIYFRPLLVEPGGHVSAQAGCFAALVNYWQNTTHPVELLVIELTEATIEIIRACMNGVSVSDVTRGIRIWETLPCRIKKIVIHQPIHMPKLNWTMRQVMWLCLPSKVLSKIHFSQQPHGHTSPKRKTDAN